MVKWPSGPHFKSRTRDTTPCRVGRYVGGFVRPSVTFLNSGRFSQYCSCPTVLDCLAVYPALFIIRCRCKRPYTFLRLISNLWDHYGRQWSDWVGRASFNLMDKFEEQMGVNWNLFTIAYQDILASCVGHIQAERKEGMIKMDVRT